jgi:hypothetical protein
VIFKISVVGDVPVDSEPPMVASLFSRSVSSVLRTHRGRVYVRVFIWVSVRACCGRLCCTV